MTPEILRCPVCSESLDRRPVRTCTVCETPFHRECGDYIGGCPRFACEEAANPRRRVAELLGLLVTERIWHHAGRMLGYPLIGIVIPPLFPIFFAVAVLHFARMCDLLYRRYLLTRPMSLDVLVGQLRKVLPGHPEVLEVPTRPPPRPGLASFCLKWSAGCLVSGGALLLAIHLGVRLVAPITGSFVLIILMAFQFIVPYAIVFRYVPDWLEWNRQTSLHGAQRVFRLWREELRTLLEEGSRGTLELTGKKKRAEG